ncbi:MAG: rubredoxin, partial [Raoultibacter sp.]
MREALRRLGAVGKVVCWNKLRCRRACVKDAHVQRQCRCAGFQGTDRLCYKGGLAVAKYVCQICNYVYDEALGIPDEGIAPGTTWEELPDDWTCPLCGAPKADFEKEETAAPVA